MSSETEQKTCQCDGNCQCGDNCKCVNCKCCGKLKNSCCGTQSCHGCYVGSCIGHYFHAGVILGLGFALGYAIALARNNRK